MHQTAPITNNPITGALAPAGALVVCSSLAVAVPGVDALEAAFAARLRAVERWDGYHGLQVWRDLTAPGHYTMVSWWQDRPTFARYMRSSDHHASHARIPKGEHGPRLDSVRRFQVVAS